MFVHHRMFAMTENNPFISSGQLTSAMATDLFVRVEVMLLFESSNVCSLLV